MPDRSSIRDEAERLADQARHHATDAIEEVRVGSNQLVDKVRELIEEGNVRRIVIKKGERSLLEIPLTVGVGAGAAALVMNPLLSAVGALAALVSDVTLVVVRDEEEAAKQEAAKQAPAAAQQHDDPADTDPLAATPADLKAASATGTEKTAGRSSSDEDPSS